MVPYRPDLREDVITLRCSTWRASRAATDAYFRWKYEEGPCHGEPLVQLAYRDGRPIGMLGNVVGRWEGGGARALLPSPADAIVVQHERARGVSLALWAASRSSLLAHGFDHAVALSANALSHPLGVRRLGFRELGSYAHLSTASPGSPARPPLLPRRLAAGGRRLARLRVRLPELGRHDRGGAVFAEAPDPERMAELVARRARAGIGQVRDDAFYAWRFRNPLATYRFVYLDGAELRGFLVLGRTGPGSAVTIVDWEAEDTEAFLRLVQALRRADRLPELVTWGATLRDDEAAALGTAGLRPSPRHGGPLVRALAAEGTERAWRLGTARLDALSEWELRPAFSDLH